MKLRIEHIESNPVAYFQYYHASPRTDLWGNQGIMSHDLPIIRATADGLPDGLDAIIMTSDLQGLVINGEQHTLLGEALPPFLEVLLPIEMGLDPQKTGVLLAGDFFATLESRGGLGDVRNVWRAFRDRFKWVVGVGGNHDDIGERHDKIDEFKRENNIYYLVNECIKINDINIGGLSGVVGENGKFNRIPEVKFSESLKKLLHKRPDIMVLHQNPYHESTAHKGGQCVTERLRCAPEQLLVCGHAIWDEPFYELPNRAQVLNTGERVFVVTKGD